ncbi:virion structural protein [Pseudomonas phage Psa21]|uniref:Virion structural protein n=1 Tax=Pseudomonas phage Psa21 TaxID=2530023 RepID=A0A481W5G8_9CAUD|nr:virion structural protein [Pseudomonas phage Psa21]QBJ02624.1 virion structural protein [Pseudomonas phage Psa21]
MDQIENPLLPDPNTTPPDVEVSNDLLEDPVDYPIDNQAELVTLIAEPSPQTIDVIGSTLQSELEIAVEAINDLLDLQSTIKAHGVSSHDMAGLVSIQKRLIDNNLSLPSAGLEDFQGYFTPERSLLNQQVSLENIGKSALLVIKAWISKLIELVMAGYRWVKGLKQKHVVLDSQLVKARDILIEVRKIYVKMKALNGPLGSEAVKTTNELSETALVTSSLDRNMVTLYGFSHEGAIRSVKTLYESALRTSSCVADRVTALASVIDNKDTPSDDGLSALSDLATLTQSIDELLIVSDDDEWLLKELGNDFWDAVDKFRKVQVIDFDKLVKYYGTTADALTRIRSVKIDDPQQAERAQVIIDSITQAVANLNRLVDFFNAAARSQVSAAKTYREYYASAIEILMLDFKSQNPSAESAKEMKALVAQLQALK